MNRGKDHLFISFLQFFRNKAYYIDQNILNFVENIWIKQNNLLFLHPLTRGMAG